MQGALGVGAANYQTAIDLLEAGTYPFAELHRETAGFDDIGALVQTMTGDHGSAGSNSGLDQRHDQLPDVVVAGRVGVLAVG